MLPGPGPGSVLCMIRERHVILKTAQEEGEEEEEEDELDEEEYEKVKRPRSQFIHEEAGTYISVPF